MKKIISAILAITLLLNGSVCFVQGSENISDYVTEEMISSEYSDPENNETSIEEQNIGTSDEKEAVGNTLDESTESTTDESFDGVPDESTSDVTDGNSIPGTDESMSDSQTLPVRKRRLTCVRLNRDFTLFLTRRIRPWSASKEIPALNTQMFRWGSS